MSDPMVREFWQARRFSAGPADRRALEPICNAILTGQLKAAGQHCQRSLKAKPYWPIVQALQSVIWIRQGHVEDALGQAQEIARDDKGKGKALGDTDLLAFLSWIMQQAGKEQDAIRLWEDAVERHTDNIQLNIEAAYFFVQIAAYGHLAKACNSITLLTQPSARPSTIPIKSQRSPSMPDEAAAHHLGFWYGAMAILLHARAKPTEAASQLARIVGIFETYIDSKGRGDPEHSILPLDTPHKVYLVIRLLQVHLQQLESSNVDHAKHREILIRFIKSSEVIEVCGKSLDVALLCRQILLEYEDEAGLLEMGRQMLDTLDAGESDWSVIETVISIATRRHPGSKPTASSIGQNKDWWQTAGDHVQDPYLQLMVRMKQTLESRSQDELEPSKKERGLTLGLLRLIAQSSQDSCSLDVLADLIWLYFRRHADKMCCFDDLIPYIASISSSEAASSTLLQHLDGQHRLNAGVSSTISKLQQLMNAEKIRSHLRLPATSYENELDRGHRCAKAYFAHMKLGDGYAPTDLQPADDLALLAGQAYVSAWTISGRVAHLELAVAILEIAVRRSKYRYQIRALLIRLYTLLGAPRLVMKHFDGMGVRQIQYDTLSHFAFDRAAVLAVASTDTASMLVTPEAPASHVETSLSNALKWIVAWYPSRADSDITQSSTQAWQRESFSVIEDFDLLRCRLQHSLARKALSLESVRVRLMTESLDSAQSTKLLAGIRRTLGDLSIVYDNRDDTVLPSLTSLHGRKIQESCSVAPRTNMPWIAAIGTLYINFLSQMHMMPEMNSSECSAQEGLLLSWAKTMLAWLSGHADPSPTDGDLQKIFKECQAQLASYTLSALPWTMLHTAQTALEAYALLDVAYQSMSTTASEIAFKEMKRLRQVRQEAKSSLKGISSRLKALVEELAKQYKGKQKLENLRSLQHCGEIAEAVLMDIATQLVEVRKAALTQMAVSITKRIAGP